MDTLEAWLRKYDLSVYQSSLVLLGYEDLFVVLALSPEKLKNVMEKCQMTDDDRKILCSVLDVNNIQAQMTSYGLDRYADEAGITNFVNLSSGELSEFFNEHGVLPGHVFKFEMIYQRFIATHKPKNPPRSRLLPISVPLIAPPPPSEDATSQGPWPQTPVIGIFPPATPPPRVPKLLPPDSSVAGNSIAAGKSPPRAPSSLLSPNINERKSDLPPKIGPPSQIEKRGFIQQFLKPPGLMKQGNFVAESSQERVCGDDLVDAVCEGALSVFNSSLQEWESKYVMLLSDRLIYADSQEDIMSDSAIKVRFTSEGVVLPSSFVGQKYSFTVTSDDGGLIKLAANEPAARREWIVNIAQVVQRVRSRSLRTRESSAVTQSQKCGNCVVLCEPSDLVICNVCKVPVCHPCSPHHIFVGMSNKPVRVCCICEKKEEAKEEKNSILKEGFVTKHSSVSLGGVFGGKPRYVVLFQTELQFYNYKYDAEPLEIFKFKEGAQITPIPREKEILFALSVPGLLSKKLVFSGFTIQETNEWIEAIKILIPLVDNTEVGDHRDNSSDQKSSNPFSRMFSRATVASSQDVSHWIPDNVTEICMECSKLFNNFRRKHHCRICGKCVCNKCSPHFIILKNTTVPVRCCTACESTKLSTAAIYQGQLFKVGKGVRSWKSRYFYLLPNQLQYYKNQYDSTAMGIIDLKQGALVTSEESHAFSLTILGATGRKYVLRSDDEKQKLEWMKVINQRLDTLDPNRMDRELELQALAEADLNTEIKHEERKKKHFNSSTSRDMSTRPQYPKANSLHEVEEILWSKKGYEAMMNFLQTEFSTENLVFWAAVEGFKEAFMELAGRSVNQTIESAMKLSVSDLSRNSYCEDDQSRNADQWEHAKTLYDIFIGVDSTTTINLPSKVVEAITSELENESGKVSVEIFDNAQAEVLYLITKDSFPRFKKTEFFETLMAETVKVHAQHALRKMGTGIEHNADTLECSKCDLPFSVIRGRYHCRFCGLTFCCKCTPRFYISTVDPRNTIRVCTMCEVGDAFKATLVAKKEGNLLKIGEHVRNWKKRFFALLPGQLVYFKKQYDPTKLGTIILSTGTQVIEEATEKGDKILFSIILSGTNGRKYSIKCADTKEAVSWIKALKKEIVLWTGKAPPVQFGSASTDSLVGSLDDNGDLGEVDGNE